jgi:hypothetical protein
MSRGRYLGVALALVSSALLQPTVQAATGQQPTQAAGQTGGTTTSAIDPVAKNALDRMGALLRSLRSFQVQATISRDDVLVDGEKVQLDSVANLVAQRPDKFRLEQTSDRQQRFFLYDGKAFTMWAPRSGYYTTVAAPPTMLEVADLLESKYDIELPLVDLFRWGSPRADEGSITSAKDIGPSTVGDTTCEQYAFRQPGLDWQIWIQSGDYPLPRKVVLTTMTDEARPGYTAVYTWNLAPSFDASSFTFVPPADAHPIPIQEVLPAQPSTQGGQR